MSYGRKEGLKIFKGAAIQTTRNSKTPFSTTGRAGEAVGTFSKAILETPGPRSMMKSEQSFSKCSPYNNDRRSQNTVSTQCHKMSEALTVKWRCNN